MKGSLTTAFAVWYQMATLDVQEPIRPMQDMAARHSSCAPTRERSAALRSCGPRGAKQLTRLLHSIWLFRRIDVSNARASAFMAVVLQVWLRG
ncbi:hypothetical protein MRB53_041856 [Persea americana]|nr:hypothetical protein MRB53_041856 [Persea americana]